MLSVRIDCLLERKVVALCGHVCEISDEPFVANLVLFTDPAFVNKRSPDHHDDTVEEAQRRIKPTFEMPFLFTSDDCHGDGKQYAYNHWWYQPTSIMNEPGEVEG